MDFKELSAYFPASDIEWRIGQAGKKNDGTIWAKALAYIDNRAIMDRLDSVCGPAGWHNEFRAGQGPGILCGISIRLPIDDGAENVWQWVTKWDGADSTDIEAVKGGLSSAMKRAAVQWGIGRYLYDFPATWVETSRERRDGWNYAKLKLKDNTWIVYYWETPQVPAKFLPDGELNKKTGEVTKAPPQDTLAPQERPPEKPQGASAAQQLSKDEKIAQAQMEGIASTRDLNELESFMSNTKERRLKMTPELQRDIQKVFDKRMLDLSDGGGTPATKVEEPDDDVPF